jgi:hypothetical protein
LYTWDGSSSKNATLLIKGARRTPFVLSKDKSTEFRMAKRLIRPAGPEIDELRRKWVSEALLKEAEGNEQPRVLEDPRPMRFDEETSLLQ